MNNIFILFPHQLFQEITQLKAASQVFLVEEYLFFNQYKFHQQKLVFHRATMKYYEDYLKNNGIKVNYIEATQAESDVRVLLEKLGERSEDIRLHYYAVFDNWLEKRIQTTCHRLAIATVTHTSDYFLNSVEDFEEYFKEKTKFFQTDFYIQQRKKRKILLQANGKPIGEKWSFDAENRLKYPKGKIPPSVKFPPQNAYYQNAIAYVQRHFPTNYGTISDTFIYPITHAESEAWLQQFLQKRFSEFGEYEDAIVANQIILHHSLLTPLLNTGLLTPLQVLNTTLAFAQANDIPLNSLEGFIRQIMGWREFICGIYLKAGTTQRTSNFWHFSQPLPQSFYTGTTGIAPIDDTIQKVLATGYCHHIERLMLLGNFMLLCEFHPNQVYQWFMEMFIDAYDWVMVPNVYGMSQFADGGLMATKPYISGSSYVLKMSNYAKGEWCETWDALFWCFMDKQRAFFSTNPRLGMLLKTYDKMSEEKKQSFLQTKNKALRKLMR